MRQKFELYANDFGVVRLDAVGPDGERDTIEIEGLDAGELVSVSVMAGTADPIHGGHS